MKGDFQSEKWVEWSGHSDAHSETDCSVGNDTAFDRAHEDLERFATIEERVDDSALEIAQRLLGRVQALGLEVPEVKPDPPEGILFLWTSGTRENGKFLDVEIRETGIAAVTMCFADGKLMFGEHVDVDPQDVQELRSLIEWVT